MQVNNNNKALYDNMEVQRRNNHNVSKGASAEAVNVERPANKVVTSDVVSAYYNIKTPTVDIRKNNLKTMFEDNKAVIYALIPRTFNAKDKDGNGLIEKGEEGGTFLNAIERLDELKSYGVNALHVLPCYKPNVLQAMGTAGSIYSARDFLVLDPKLDDKNDSRTVDEEFKQFTDECHKRGIRVMLDIPGCAGIDFYENRPELMSKNEDGTPKIPQGWQDIRMMEAWNDKDKKELNEHLVNYYKEYVDKYIDLGVDGFRVDVARSKPTEFWNEIIPYARKKDPECAFLAESYTYEDASPMANVSADRPEDLLRAGFDSYYGQYHIFNEWNDSKEFHDNMILNLEMSKNLPGKKSLIGSFATHDDKSPMSSGGVDYVNLTTGIQDTLPMTNPYFVTGVETGDRYIYPYANKINTTTKSDTDCNKYIVHHEKLDIFNASAKPQGEHPEIGKFMGEMAKVRNRYEDVITKGSYIPLATSNKDDKIIAYARHYKGKTILVVANKDVNNNQSGKINIKGLKPTQVMNDLAPQNAGEAKVSAYKDGVEVTLSPAKFTMFEIDTPEIEKSGVKVYKQHNI